MLKFSEFSSEILNFERILTELKASISSFDSVREGALTRGSSRVVCIVASEQFVSLFLVFLRPRLVFLVACYFDEVVFRGFLSIPRILTELRSE